MMNSQYFRKIRSRLKKKLRNGAILSRKQLSTYHISRKKHAALSFHYDLETIKKEKIEANVPRYNISIPEVLCVIKEPISTLKFLDKIKNDLSSNLYRNIFIDHSNTKIIGLAASHLFDDIIASHAFLIRQLNLKFYLSGQTSQVREINNFLLAAGFFRIIDLPLEQIKIAADLAYSSKYPATALLGNKNFPHRKGIAATGLTDYFDKCLKFSNKQITITGRARLIEAFGELIGNAEEHISEPNNWHVLGCYQKDTGYMQFAIINNGESIYQTLSSEQSTAKDVIEKIQGILESQKNKLTDALTGLFKPKLNWEDTIWNVMALQEGVSSKRFEDSIETRTRGQGLMDFLEFIIQASAASKDRSISILSGYSYIYIDFEKYKISKAAIINSLNGETEIRRKICFNETNDLKMPQDEEYVFPLPCAFEGTIITGSFKLTDNFTAPKKETF
jgi:hypothetical protein